MVRIHELGGWKIVGEWRIGVGIKWDKEGSFINFIRAWFWRVIYNRKEERERWKVELRKLDVVIGSVKRETAEVEYSFKE